MLVSSKLAKSMAIPERTNIMIDTCRWWTGMELKQGWAHTQQAHLSCFPGSTGGHRGHEVRLGPQRKWHGKRMNTTIHICRKHTVYVIPAFETYGNLKEAAAQVSWAAVCVDTPSRP